MCFDHGVKGDLVQETFLLTGQTSDWGGGCRTYGGSLDIRWVALQLQNCPAPWSFSFEESFLHLDARGECSKKSVEINKRCAGRPLLRETRSLPPTAHFDSAAAGGGRLAGRGIGDVPRDVHRHDDVGLVQGTLRLAMHDEEHAAVGTGAD